MKFIKRTLVSCTLGFAAVLVGSIVFENLYYWGASHGGFLIGLGLAASQFVVYKDDIDRLVANAKGKGSKGSAEQAERQAAPQGKEPAMTLEEESKTSAMSSPPLEQTPTTGICPRKNSGTKPHPKRLPFGEGVSFCCQQVSRTIDRLRKGAGPQRRHLEKQTAPPDFFVKKDSIKPP